MNRFHWAGLSWLVIGFSSALFLDGARFDLCMVLFMLASIAAEVAGLRSDRSDKTDQ